MGFPKWPEPLDADHPTGKVYNFIIVLPATDSITAALVEVVDGSSTTVDPAPATTITEVAWAVLTTDQKAQLGVTGNGWGVSFRAQGGVAGYATIRCRYDTALENGDDATWRLSVRQR